MGGYYPVIIWKILSEYVSNTASILEIAASYYFITIWYILPVLAK